MLDLLERIAALEKELERARAQNNVSTPIDTVITNGVGASSAASQRTPSWNGPLLSRTTAACEKQLSYAILRNQHSADIYISIGIYNDTTPTPLAGSYAWTTPNGSSRNYMPRKLPDLPVFGGQPEDWPIFLCAYTETTQAYNCTDLENNQRRALKDEARETVKSLLIHPSNVSTVVEQLRFRYGLLLQFSFTLPSPPKNHAASSMPRSASSRCVSRERIQKQNINRLNVFGAAQWDSAEIVKKLYECFR
ncbi:GL19329 [Drosophila persimilis]|uniref:GL19329 n=1 Tax=Drosophila persimilis TaxID=7234 RepID=B4HDL3_DROPE|nr:GL19329 [Drosophila persimilis]